MSNWPNIQEYRNFEAKFFNKPNELMSCAAEGENDGVDLGCIVREDLPTNPRHLESKTVRCVIKKDFEETFKKLDRGDGLAVSCDSRPKIRESSDQSVVDKIRLQNHLKWKKQKEEEYLQKKEAEKLAQQKKKEEEERSEKIKKQKEKEREGKIREWQEQKAREKEEKKKEKMVMKMLEDELKEVAPVVDKDKLIEEWVKLKNKQKQIEAEKKAHILKKKEESRALRQNLAEMSYRQWMERVKGRMMTLPKNGYQIFGPKPIPVVKEDWNNDFTSISPREEMIALSGSKSNITFRSPTKPLDDYPKNLFVLGDLKNRSPSFHLKSTKSGIDVHEDMPLKELQPGTLDLKKNSELLQGVPKLKFGEKDASHKFLCLDDSERNPKRCTLPSSIRKPLRLFNEFPEVLPDKMKIDLYIDTNGDGSPVKQPKKPVVKKPQKKETVEEETPVVGKKKTAPKVKLPAPKSLVSLQGETKPARKPEPRPTSKPCRRSRSYDKPSSREKGFATSKSLAKITDERKVLKSTSKASCAQRKKSRRRSKPNTPEGKKKTTAEGEGKGKKRSKKKSPFLSKSFSLSGSPYCAKGKLERRKSEAKSDRAGQSRKSSTTKI